MAELQTVQVTRAVVRVVNVAGPTIKAVRVAQAIVNVSVPGEQGEQGPAGELPAIIDGGNF
jgi:hypothetical protein